eukprot:6181487-Pleurochrysis_carterae.AAC.1
MRSWQGREQRGGSGGGGNPTQKCEAYACRGARQRQARRPRLPLLSADTPSARQAAARVRLVAEKNLRRQRRAPHATHRRALPSPNGRGA